MRKELSLGFDIQSQPDEVTCGPTCLHALYQYYGEDVSLKQVIREVKHLKTGGTLAVMLGNHALQRGYKAHIYTYNLNVYDSIKGEPVGHFVIISGYEEEKNSVYLADPMTPNPLGKGQVYKVSFPRLINSIMLGIVTYDANLLVIEPKKKTMITKA